MVAFGATFLLPTVVLNSAWWAQCDSIYVSLCLGSLYFLLRRQTALACAAFGLAFAFKLQAVFFLPALVVLVVVNRQRLRGLALVPAAFLAALVPAWVAGRSLASQLSVYPAQVANPSGAGAAAAGVAGPPAGGLGGGVRGGGGFGGGGPGGGGGFGGGGGATTSAHSFTSNAPTWYAWLPADASTVWKWVGLGRRRRGRPGPRRLAARPAPSAGAARRWCSSPPRSRSSSRCCCRRCTSATSSSARCSRWSRSSSTGASSSWPR